MFAYAQLRARNATGTTPVELANRGWRNTDARAVSVMVTADPSVGQWLRRLNFENGTTQACIQGIQAPMLQELWMLNHCPRITDLTTLLPKVSPCLTHVYIRGTNITDVGIAGLETPWLRSLCVSRTRYLTDLTTLLHSCRTLTSLDLRRSNVSQQGILGIEAPSLEYLSLTHCRGITDLTTLLKDCKSLIGLDLGDTGVDQAGIAGVEAPLLEELFLTDCRNITNITALVAGGNSLKQLDLGGSGVTQAGITGVEAPQLEGLYINGCVGITDITALLQGCRTLTTFYCRGSGLPDGTVNVWAPVPGEDESEEPT